MPDKQANDIEEPSTLQNRDGQKHKWQVEGLDLEQTKDGHLPRSNSTEMMARVRHNLTAVLGRQKQLARSDIKLCSYSQNILAWLFGNSRDQMYNSMNTMGPLKNDTLMANEIA